MIQRETLYERCSGYCEKCGRPLGNNWAAHHRKLRKHGGSDSLANVIALHHECHNLGTKSVHLNPSDSYRDGYLVRSWADPLEVPILLPDGSVKFLTEDGTYCERKTL